ncbi:hypothetical protein J6590_062357 [Homalodisca vitripennis]|nr:hypothetical protein J6590_062357 [Homalodisca vitripennis]
MAEHKAKAPPVLKKSVIDDSTGHHITCSSDQEQHNPSTILSLLPAPVTVIDWISLDKEYRSSHHMQFRPVTTQSINYTVAPPRSSDCHRLDFS